MSPTSPSSNPVSVESGEKGQGTQEVTPLEPAADDIVAEVPPGDVDMEDVSELALGMEDWASKQLELLARQLQEEAEREQDEQGRVTGLDGETGGNEAMDLTLNDDDDDHDLSSLVQSATTDIFRNTAPEDLMAAIINQTEQGNGLNPEMLGAGSTGGIQDETENMINSFFSSDFLDQLNESSSEQIDLDILGAVGQMQMIGSGIGEGDGQGDVGLDDFNEEDQAALLRDLVALSRQPSISPSFEEPGFQLPEMIAEGTDKPLQAQPIVDVDGSIVPTDVGLLDSARPSLEPAAIPDQKESTPKMDETPSQPKVDSPALPEISVPDNKLVTATSEIPKPPAPAEVKPPSDTITPISNASAGTSLPSKPDADKPAVIQSVAASPSVIRSQSTTPASASAAAPVLLVTRPGSAPLVPAAVRPPQPRPQGPSAARPPSSAPNVRPSTPRPGIPTGPRPITTPRPRPVPSAQRPPPTRPSPFVSNRAQSVSTPRPAPPPNPATGSAPRPAVSTVRPGLSQRPVSGPVPNVTGRPAMAGPGGVRPVSSGSIPSSALKRPPGTPPRPPFIGPARPPSTVPRPPGSSLQQPRPSASTILPRPSSSTLGQRPAPAGVSSNSPVRRPPSTVSQRPLPATGLRPAPLNGPRPSATTGPRPAPAIGPRPAPAIGPRPGPATGPRPGPATGPRPPSANGPRPPSVNGPRPAFATAPRPPSAGLSQLAVQPIPKPPQPQEPDESHQNKRRRLEPGSSSESLNVSGLEEFADILSIPIPGMSQINGDMLDGTGGEKLSQAQIDEIVASLGRPAALDDRIEDEGPGMLTSTTNAAAGPSRSSPERETDSDLQAVFDEEIDELDDDDDPASQAQELLAMISALLPPGDEDNKDDPGQSEDELDPEHYKMEDSPAPSISDDKPRKENETPAEKKEKKRRNRLVLSCTECHRRKQQCDRNIPCARCVKRGVPELCHMEAPMMPPRKNKRKRDDGAFLQAMSEPGFDWNARVRALEDLLRTNPAAFADLDLNGSLVNGVSSLQMPLSEMPTADEQEMQNQVQAVISLINQAQAAQHQLELEAQKSLPELTQLAPTGPMLPSASSLQSSPGPPVSSPKTAPVPKPLALSIKVEQGMSAPNSPMQSDRLPSPIRQPSAVAIPTSKKQSNAVATQPPHPPFRPGSVPPVAESATSLDPVLAGFGIAGELPLGSPGIRKDIRPDSPTATPPPPPPAASGPALTMPGTLPAPSPPVAPTPGSTAPVTISRESIAGSEPVVVETDDAMQIDTPPAAIPEGPPDVTGIVSEAVSQTLTEPSQPQTTGDSAHQSIRVDSSSGKSVASPLLGSLDKPMELPSLDQTANSQLEGQRQQLDEAMADGDSGPESNSIGGPIPARGDGLRELTSSKQEPESVQPLSPQVKADNPRDTGTLNIPANLQAELAKLAKGVQDSAYTDDLNGNGLDINMSNILSDPSALLAQLASTMTPPAIPQASAQDESQNAMLMDMISQLANGGTAAQNTSLLSNLLAPPPTAAPANELWSQVPQAVPETNQQVAISFMTDLGHNKLNLGLSGFRQDDGSIFVPPTTRSVERSMHMRGGLSHDALPIEGHPPFLDLGVKFAYGKDGHAFKDGRIAAVQAMSLTGALRIGSTFLSRFPAQPTPKMIFIPNPTVEEEAFAIRDSGLEIHLYRFFDRRTGSVDWEGMREDLQNAPAQSIVLLHVGGSTPTGAELSTAQWRLITEVIKQQRHIPFFIMEYQGLSSGNVDRDAQPLRTMAQKRIPLVLAQTFDAAMGLYSDSPAILSVVTNAAADKPRIESQLRSISRTMHAHPPPWGAHVAANILGNETAYTNWSQEVKAMADRLKSIRDKLFDQLTNRLKTPGNWSHIRKTQGMYCTTLLTTEQLQVLGYREHIHLLPDGCFSLGCLNAAKIEQLARAIDNVIRHPPPLEEDDLAAQAALQIEMALRQGFGPDAGF